MQRTGSWPPVWIGVGLLATSATFVMFIPETLKVKPSLSEENERHESHDQSWLSRTASQVKESVSVFRSSSLILLLVACLGSLPIFYATSSFMTLFISKRYGMRLYQSGYVQSGFGVAQMIIQLVVLPWVSKSLMRSNLHPYIRPADDHHRDLSLARWSYGMTMAAVGILGLAPSLGAFVFGLVVLALGSGCSSLTRSLMGLYVDPAHRSRVFGLVGMVEVVGAAYTQPMLAGLFSLGMSLGGGWIGLPYYSVALIVALITGLLLFVRVPHKARQ